MKLYKYPVLIAQKSEPFTNKEVDQLRYKAYKGSFCRMLQVCRSKTYGGGEMLFLLDVYDVKSLGILKRAKHYLRKLFATRL